MSGGGVCVAYLCWGPLGRRPVEEFAASYRAHPAGSGHRLVIALKDVQDPGVLEACRSLAGDAPHAELLEVGSQPLDLGTYAEIAQRVEAEALCFVNTGSVVRDTGWLAKLTAQLAAPGIGLAGASGSYESFSTHAPFVTRPLRKRQFPLFPNAHVRTNAFALPRTLMLRLDWGRVTRKIDAWKLESGRHNITRQVWERGLDAVVVGRDGRAYGREQFYESNTFRRGDQPNLLVSDNRTREFETADPERRRFLFELAWGKDALDTSDPDQPWIGPRAAVAQG
ncbi:MAG TPA: hypothetical protein VFB51_07245 [Solirubrobacterales bacterium]|nr:hypothetical protein [Solirubrobacterales bacterium]